MPPSPYELELEADALLHAHARTELCRECGAGGTQEAGVLLRVYDKRGKPVVRNGQRMLVECPMYTCPNGHAWFAGEGRPRGIDGEDAILFDEHLKHRKKREIYTERGTPDPELVSGLFNRAHPQGRRLNTKDGEGFYA